MSPSISFAPSTAASKPKQSIYSSPSKKQKMSITQTYFLAHSARGKLSREAARPDHNLRLLVGHANMLDTLMVDLANAEQEQERWFNQSLSGARDEEVEESAHEATIVEEPEEDWEIEDAQSEDDFEFEHDEVEVKEHEVAEDDDEDDDSLALTRIQSRHSPPELAVDFDSDSEDDATPPSPPNVSVPMLTEKQRQAIATTSFYESKNDSPQHDAYYMSPNSDPILIAAH